MKYYDNNLECIFIGKCCFRKMQINVEVTLVVAHKWKRLQLAQFNGQLSRLNVNETNRNEWAAAWRWDEILYKDWNNVEEIGTSFSPVREKLLHIKLQRTHKSVA